jgi:hypothetical protein
VGRGGGPGGVGCPRKLPLDEPLEVALEGSPIHPGKESLEISDSVVASRKPRARSITVKPTVMALVIVERGANAVMSTTGAKFPLDSSGEWQ